MIRSRSNAIRVMKNYFRKRKKQNSNVFITNEATYRFHHRNSICIGRVFEVGYDDNVEGEQFLFFTDLTKSGLSTNAADFGEWIDAIATHNHQYTTGCSSS